MSDLLVMLAIGSNTLKKKLSQYYTSSIPK